MPSWLQDITVSLHWPEPQLVVRVVAAVFLGGLIGLERELRDKPAGFRTIILICVGACIFTMISQRFGGGDGESTRIAAQVVSGIGFLGAGAILRGRGHVFGLTTAATIWAVAAIGMAVGFGDLPLALLGTVFILIALFIFDAIEHWIGRRRDLQGYCIVAPNQAEAAQRIAELFKEAKLQTRKRTWYEEEGSLVFDVRAMGTKSNHDRLRMKLARSPQFRLRKP